MKKIQYFFYAILFLSLIIVWNISSQFLSAVFLAFITVALTRPIYSSFYKLLYRWLVGVRSSKIYKFFTKVLTRIYKGYTFVITLITKLPLIRRYKESFVFSEKEKNVVWVKILSENMSIFLTVCLILFFLSLVIGLLFLPTVKEVSMLSKTYFDEQHLVAFFNEVKQLVQQIYPIETTSEVIVQKIQEYAKPILTFLSNQLLAFTGTASDWFTNGILFTLFLIYLYPNYNSIIDLFKQLSPLPDDQDEQILVRILDMVKATVVGTWVVAFIQAVITTLVFLAIGFDYSFFMGFLAFLLSLIPAVGPAVLTIPFGIYHYTSDNISYGHLLIGITLLNSTIDLLIRPVFTPKHVRLNTAMFTLSVFGGLSYFGVLGLLYGPILFIVFFTIIELYFIHYQAQDLH